MEWRLINRLAAEDAGTVPARSGALRPTLQLVVPMAAVAIGAVAAMAGIALQSQFPISDAALFEYIGRTIARGHLLYRDVWDNKLPGVYYMNALWQLLFGERYWLHAAAETVVALISSVLLAILARSFELRAWQLTGAVLAVFLCTVMPLNTTETYALPLLLGALLCARNGWPIASALLIALATMFWIPSVLLLAPVAILLSRRDWLVCFTVTVVLLAAAASIMTLAYGVSTIEALVRSWITYVASSPVKQSETPPESSSLRTSLAIVHQVSFYLVLSGAGPLLLILSALLRRPATLAQRFGLTWTVAMLLGTAIGPHFYPHYFIASLAAMLFTIAACAVEVRWNRVRIAIAVLGALLLARTAIDCMTYWKTSHANSRLVAKIGRAIAPVAAQRATLSVDVYEPGLYLALDPKLRDPFEIAQAANFRFVASTVGDWNASMADIRISTGGKQLPGIQVARRTAAPWTIFANPSLAKDFATLP